METLTIKVDDLVGFSEEQFFQLCVQNKELRFERDKNNNVIIMSPVGLFSSSYHSELLGELRNWNKLCKLGRIFDSSGGFTLPNGSVRSPDVAWISNQRWENISFQEKERFAHICPDFIIEVRSKSDSLKLQKEKMDEWMQSGCLLAWLFDMENQKVYIYRPGKDIITQDFAKELTGEDVLPGFKPDLSDFIF